MILERLDANANPEALLFRVFALVARWEYAETVPLLEAYLASPRVTGYRRLVGKMNLAIAHLVESRLDTAGTLLEELLTETQGDALRRLHGIALEHAAQRALLAGQWAEAERYLDRAEAAIGDPRGLQQFFMRKWRALLELERSGAGEPSLRQLDAVRAEAAERGHWETIRQCDRFQSIRVRDRSLLHRLVFGTPFEEYRRRLLIDFKEPVRLPEEFRWSPGGSVGGPEVDLYAGILLKRETGTSTEGKEGLESGSVAHRALVALASDFYRPLRVASLHFRIYPGEFFNAVSSPTRVHHALAGLREWVTRQRFPMTTALAGGGIRLRALAPCTLLVRREGVIAERGVRELTLLKASFGERLFSASEAERTLEMPLRSCVRLLGEQVSSGRLERRGQGRATRYRLSRG